MGGKSFGKRVRNRKADDVGRTEVTSIRLRKVNEVTQNAKNGKGKHAHAKMRKTRTSCLVEQYIVVAVERSRGNFLRNRESGSKRGPGF